VITMTENDRNASYWQVAKAVFWSFLGIRRRAQHEQDAVKMRPVQVVIAGIIGAVIFILALATFARYMVGHAG
jgi:hypothetical protein